MAPSATTRVAAVIGSPIRHSLSPVLLNTAFASAGVDWTFVAFEVRLEQLPDAFAGARALGLGGFSVTMPLKQAAAACADRLSSDAEVLGAANCIVNDGGLLVGHNTDGDGFVSAMASMGHEIGGRRCALVGAGGSARSIALSLGRHGAADVAVINRTPARAEHAAALAGPCGRVIDPADCEEVLSTAELIINATSVGMGDGSSTETPFDPQWLGEGRARDGSPRVVVDIVYRPLRTTLLQRSAERGFTVINGVPMLVGQAARQFELWTGTSAPTAAMTAAVAEHLV